jgi:hypothetical protein
MTHLTQLERRACEIAVEALNGAIAEAEHGYEKDLRLRIALIWEQYPSDLDILFREIYLDSLKVRITGVTDRDAVDTITDFPAMADFTQNVFMAPILVYAARKMDWESIAANCVDLFFDSRLMGDFSCPADAVEEFSDSYDYD